MFENTEISFQSKSERDLKQSKRLFQLLRKSSLVKIGKILLKTSIFLNIPINSIIKKLFFKQFCWGETIEECQNLINRLSFYNIKSTLDYCVEGKKNSDRRKQTFNEIIETIEESKENTNIPFCVFKMSGVLTLMNDSYVTDFWCQKNTEKIKILDSQPKILMSTTWNLNCPELLTFSTNFNEALGNKKIKIHILTCIHTREHFLIIFK